MRARFFCPVGDLKGSDFEIRGEATLGRSADSTIVLASRSVSNHHARIVFDSEAGHFRLEDLGSLNGTHLDGAPVKGTETLGSLHVITLGGKHEFVFQDLGAFPKAFAESGAKRGSAVEEGTLAEQSLPQLPMAGLGNRGPRPEGPTGEGTLMDRDLPDLPSILAGKPLREVPGTSRDRAPREVPGTSQTAPRTSLDEPSAERTMVDQELPQLPSILAGAPSREVPGTSQEGPSEESPVRFLVEVRALTGESSLKVLADGENVVGREVGADVHIPNASVSRRHAVLTVAGGAVTVRDLGSRNKTFVEDREVPASAPMTVAAGMVLRFGNVEAVLIVQDPVVQEPAVDEPDASGGGEESR